MALVLLALSLSPNSTHHYDGSLNANRGDGDELFLAELIANRMEDLPGEKKMY